MGFSGLSLKGGAFCAASCDVIDKILKLKDCDAALLYLYMLRNSGEYNEREAQNSLGFDKIRLEQATFTLINLEIVTDNRNSTKPNVLNASGRYKASELRIARTKDNKFSAVCTEAENLFGQPLTEGQLRTLYSAYERLQMPADVLIEMLSYLKTCKSKVTRGDIESEAYLWVDMGISDCDGAQEYIKRRQMSKPIEEDIALKLKINDRNILPKEQAYITEFIDMGFSGDAVLLASEKVHKYIGKFSWRYMQKILQGWNEQKAHTVSQISQLELSKNYNKKKSHENRHDTPDDVLSDWEKHWLNQVKKHVWHG